VTAEAQKQAAGEAAAALVESGMVVGLGTGSTAVHFVRALAARKLDIRGVPTSQKTATLAEQLGIALTDLDSVKGVDLTIDGADEIGPGLAIIKGGGGALLREKLVWEASSRCVTIADAAKHVPFLGAFALPVEVVNFGPKAIQRRLCDVLADFEIAGMPKLRLVDGQPFRTDQGNIIYDIACGRILDPAALAEAIKSLTGVVEHGLFLDLADEALLGTETGVDVLQP